MCGILAIGGLDRPFHQGLLKSLRKRGPDSLGFWADSHAQLAQTRLAILGLDERGEQPQENHRHVITYNGEIYNFHAIRERVEARSIRIHGGSDTEVLLHAWTLWGPEILKDLSGFWAFAIYDKEAKKLFLVRDQLGIKPLYYWKSGKQFVAASMIRTILEAVDESPELDYEALSEYVRYQFTFGDKTFVKQIKKVTPGHVVEIDLVSGDVESKPYEDILVPSRRDRLPIDAEQILAARELLLECCKESTISDTSFTTFCSGGVDSSLITRVTEPDVAYHCNYSDPECNETFFAREVVANTKTRLMVVNAAENFDLVEKLRDLVDDFDELTIGSVILPLDDLLAQVKRRYKVILTGTGGDELFAGYVRYQLALGECFQDSYRMLFDKMKPVTEIPKRFEMTHRKGNVSLYKFYEPRVEQTFLDSYESCRGNGTELEAMLAFDRRYFLSGLLNIDDKMCGRHSLESRPSFLHQRFVRHVLQLNSADMIKDGMLKGIGREIALGFVPRSVTHRVDKMGFTTPIGTFVNKGAHRIREQIMTSKFRHLYKLSGMNFTAENKFSREVFGLLLLDLWLHRYIKPPEPPSTTSA
jgi:asparagine synthase (glutamine-hydrolysing)